MKLKEFGKIVNEAMEDTPAALRICVFLDFLPRKLRQLEQLFHDEA